ncbi:MAG TPA: hypothetical protein P5235_05460 [Saprospiraceae bacterium]|nr:hypothetical protein [Saprospiraceae bacterium]
MFFAAGIVVLHTLNVHLHEASSHSVELKAHKCSHSGFFQLFLQAHNHLEKHHLEDFNIAGNETVVFQHISALPSENQLITNGNLTPHSVNNYIISTFFRKNTHPNYYKLRGPPTMS